MRNIGKLPNDKILCTGTLIVDIFNTPVERALGPNEGTTTKIFALPGGNAFNVSKDLALLHYPAGSITCCGAIGEDVFGRMFCDELRDIGVSTELYSEASRGTSKIFMLKVENEEPRYYLDEGANAHLSAEFVLSALNRIKPAVFYTGETGTLRNLLPAFPQMMKTARSAGCLTLVDTVIPYSGDWSYIYNSSDSIDVLKCNEFEAVSIAKTTDMRAALRLLSETGIPLVIISLAEKGLLFSYENAAYELPPFRVPCVDATGAGDAFNAGIIKCFTEASGSSLSERLGADNELLIRIMTYAAACGAAAVTEFGCCAGVSAAYVDRLLAEQGEAVREGCREVGH